MRKTLTLLCTVLAVADHTFALSLPNLLGENLVGTVAIEIVDHSRLDPYAPTPQPRDLMISVFFPVRHVRRYNLATAYTPLYGTYLDSAVGVPSGTAESIISQAYKGAYLHTKSDDVPSVILYSPGLGNSRVDYTQAMSNLASHGYMVVGIDHPYDTGFIDYPDGRTAIASLDLTDTNEHIVAAQNVRVKDIQFVLTALTTNATFARQIPGVHGALRKSKIGMFGHSFGGAATANTMAVDSRIACGVNMDGAIFGTVLDTGLDKPFMFFDAGARHNRTTDPSWATLWGKLRGYKLELSFEGAAHSGFSDQAVLYDDLRALGLIPDLGNPFGDIKGERMLQLEYAYLTAFFDRCLRNGGGELLDGPSAKYPEIVFWP